MKMNIVVKVTLGVCCVLSVLSELSFGQGVPVPPATNPPPSNGGAQEIDPTQNPTRNLNTINRRNGGQRNINPLNTTAPTTTTPTPVQPGSSTVTTPTPGTTTYPQPGQPNMPTQTPLPGAGMPPPVTDNSLSPSSYEVPEVKVEIPEKKGADGVPPGQELVSIHFPEPTEIKDIIKAVSLWTGKNVILGDKNISGKVQIISPRNVTKEEAYQAFLSALNLLQLTTVETGKVIKIMQITQAVKGNLKTFMGTDWTPRTDEVITQIVPLKYIDAKAITNTLRTLVNSRPGSLISYEPTNTLIISDSGYIVRRILDIIKLIDVQGQQPQVSIVPIRYADAKDIADKVEKIFGGGGGAAKAVATRNATGGAGYAPYKIFPDERSNSVVVFGPPRTIADVKDLVRKFDIRVDDPQNTSTIHVRPLDYADAKKLATTLQALASGGAAQTPTGFGPRRFGRGDGGVNPVPGANVDTPPAVAKLDDNVKITADESSNSLLITGSRAAYQALNTIIRKLDVRRSQVFVEGDILDVGLNDDFKFGTSILAGFTDDKYYGPIGWQAGKGAGQVSIATSSAAVGGPNGLQGALVALNDAFKDDLTVGILSSKPINIPGLGDVTPGALIKLLKTDSNTKQLSSPQILTANNEEANITVGQSQYFKIQSDPSPTTGISTTSTRKVDANLSLTVKPAISHSNYVTLDIKIEADSLGNLNADEIPAVNTRKSSQIVTVKNKQTVVISGLIKNFEGETYEKIPLLGDIPVLGWLFRNTTTNKTRSNLMMFLTPYIVHGADDLADIYKSKREDTDEFFYKVYGRSFNKTAFYASVPSYEDGKYVEDPIDRMEQERRNQMLKHIHESSRNDTTYDVGSSSSNVDSTPTTVPAGVVGGSGSSSVGGQDYQPVEPRDEPEPIEPQSYEE